ncbi:SLAM family member 8-like [Emydura macquarii macquarii]|uniref:SLAM family member 8-like n=1 Tax=Emydura macquarii macquarii TaxID=1129001 RepID=UPI00352A70C1
MAGVSVCTGLPPLHLLAASLAFFKLQATEMEVKFTSRRPSVPLLLLTLSSFFFAGIIISQAQTPHHQVNGILGGSVLLSLNPSPGMKVEKIEWIFSAGTGVKIQLAEFNGKFERPDPSDRFKQRLEMYNRTSLKIQALELNDSGVYEARIALLSAVVQEQTFLLTVYEPVPVPEIRHHSVSSTSDGCNVSLQCLVSGTEKVNVSWRRGNPLQDLSDLEWYELTPDGRTLHLTLQPSSTASTFTCMASNPVDRSSVSFDLQSVCQSGDTGTWKWPIFIGLFVVIAACAGTWLWKRRRKKPVGRAPEEEHLSQPLYAQIWKRSPPEGNDPDPGCPRERPAITTVYDQVRMVQASSSERLS